MSEKEGSKKTDVLMEQAIDAAIHRMSLKNLVRIKVHQYFEKVDTAHVENVYEMMMAQIEPVVIETALQKNDYNQIKTAQMLGINRNTLKKKLDLYKIKMKKK